MKRIITWITLNPAAILFVVNAFGSLAVAWGLHWSADGTGVVDGIITAVITVIVTASTRPINLQLLVGGALAVITALAPLGLHLTADQISTGSVVLSLLLAGVFHLAHTPYVADKQGTTGNALQSRRSRPATPAV